MEAAATAEGLVVRKGEIENRLQVIGSQSLSKNPSPTPGASVDSTTKAATIAAEISTTSTKRFGRKSTRKNIVDGEDDRDKQDDFNNSNNSNNKGTNHQHLIPFIPKFDTHWDFVMKEMMWLGADFQGERKRQVSLAKKMALRYVLVCG